MPVPWPEIAAHRERLVRIARRRCPTFEDAEDVVQEAMIRCATFEGLDADRLGQFLTTVVIRLCADLHRDAERGTRAVRHLAGDPGTEPSPEELACAAAEAAALRAYLDALPPRQRDVLVDRAHGLSVTQISDRHALTYKSAESALSRARTTMRSALASGLAVVTGAVAATAAFARRRPAAVVALPAATLVLATSVMRTPLFDGDVPAHAAPPRVVTGTAYEPPAAAVRVARPVARRPRAAARPVLRPMPVSVVVRHEKPVVDVDAGGISRTTVTDTRNEDEVAFVQRCVREGVWVRLRVEGREIEQSDGCGAPPPR